MLCASHAEQHSSLCWQDLSWKISFPEGYKFDCIEKSINLYFLQLSKGLCWQHQSMFAMQQTLHIEAKRILPLNPQERHLKFLLHISLPLLSSPSLLHKGLGVLGNNWASSMAGCGRILSYLHYYTLYLGGGQFLFISPQMKIHPSNLGGGEHQNKWIISLEHLVLSTNLIRIFMLL